MSIPSQNEFLFPFLDFLKDGQTYTRSQLLFKLAKHYNVSQEEAQQMSGSQFTLVSRVAWCDVHFVKAGFVSKRQDSSDSVQDEFRITPLGVRELERSGDKLTVGYLQSFYRGKIYRGAGSDDTTSDAELELYESFEKLPDEFTVFHSVKWFGKSKGTVGEVDFIIAHRTHGILVLEVKGGEVTLERKGNNSEWTSRDQNGRIHSINDPCEQAERNRRALWDWLAEDQRTRGLRFAIFPAVALPDSRVDKDIRPDCPQDIFIDIRHLGNLEKRLLEIYAYWKPHADVKNSVMAGKPAVDALIQLLIPSRQLQPRVSDIFERERQKIDELTHTQFRILRQIRSHKRAAIVGGAGSGKTMLAMEKAQQLADAGFRVLFVCFNRGLADWVGENLKHPNILCSTFHGLVGYARNWARVQSGPKFASWDALDERAPDLLMDALSIIRSPDSGALDKLFDAIIVDEAQDFEDTWWVPLSDLLRDPKEGVFYVFFDNNQRLYKQIGNVPMEGDPFFLDENCRNTQHIHEQISRYIDSAENTTCEGPEGRPVEIIPAPDKAAVRRELQKILHRLINEQGIRPNDIVILTPASDKRSQWKEGDQIGNFMLTWDMKTTLSGAVRVCTIYRYKGLESAVVILTELDRRNEEFSNQLVYVGLSRARHHAIIIGELPPPIKNGDGRKK